MRIEIIQDANGNAVIDPRTGQPALNYITEHAEGGGVVQTGDITGTVTLADGTVYDVTPALIEHDDPEHGQQIADAIEARLIAEGRLPEPLSFKTGSESVDDASAEAPAVAES